MTRRIVATRDGACSTCPQGVRVGESIWWNARSREVRHISCDAAMAARAEAEGAAQRTAARAALLQRFEAAPRAEDAPRGWTHALVPGVIGWEVYASVAGEHVYLTDAEQLPTDVVARRRVRVLPASEELVALLEVARW